jgi:sodium transport system permease protein
VTGPGFPEGSRVPTLGATLAFLLIVAGIFVLGGAPLQILLGEAGLLAAQVGLLLVPALLFVRLGRFDPVRTLSLRLPSRGQVAGGLLVLAGGVQLAWFLAWAQSLVVPVPVEYLEAMATALQADSLGRFLWLLLIAALTPAVAEEVLFRGVLLTGLRQALPAGWAIVGAGVVFGLFHLAPQTAFRFLPTAWLGVLLAGVVVATGSLPLAILLHAVNNSVILAVTALPVAREGIGDPEAAPPLMLLPVAALLFAWGAAILVRRMPRSERPERPG